MSVFTGFRRRTSLALGLLMLIGVGFLVTRAFAEAEVTKFMSNGGSAGASSQDPTENGYIQRSISVTENGLQGDDRKVFVQFTIRHVQNSPSAFSFRTWSGEIPAGDFSINGKSATLNTDGDAVPNPVSISFHGLPLPGDPGQITLEWTSNGLIMKETTGHTTTMTTDPETGATMKVTKNGQSSDVSADVAGQFAGDFLGSGTVGQNRNLTITVENN